MPHSRYARHAAACTLLPALLVFCAPGASNAADLTAREVAERLVAADPDRPLDLAGKDLVRLDLSGLDFKRARLAGADLFGADLTGSDLTRADLAGAKLDRTVLIGVRLDHANLAGASLLRPSAFSTLGAPASEAPSLVGADLSDAKIFGRFNRADLSGANLRRASMAPFGKTGFIEHIWRTELLGARLEGADLTGADMTHALLRYANLRGARMADVVLRNADLSGADLTGADLAGADLTDADLDGTILTGVTGLDRALGLAEARNAAKAVR